jgi:hypothetical protein
MKTIQVFLVGDTTAELSGKLVKMEHKKTGSYFTVKDECDYVWTHYFPHAQIRMVRMFNEKA